MVVLEKAAPKRIVIIDWSMIGDLIMLSPCVRAIKTNYPDAHIAVLGQPNSIATFKRSPHVDQLIPYDRSGGDFDLGSFFKAVKALRQGRFDTAFIFHNSIGSAIMAWLGRIRHRVGYRHEMRDLLLTKRIRRTQELEHLILVKANLLRAVGVPVDLLTEEVFIDKDRASKWVRSKLGPNLGRSRPIVVIGIGATMKYKQWSSAALNSYLNSFPINSVDFVFTGAPEDRKLFEGVYSYNNTVVDLVGQTTLEELSWVMAKADLYVGPDSGPMHLALGLNIPVVALFGATNPERCGPFQYPKAEVIRAHQLCSDCERDFGKTIRQCLHTLKPDEVYLQTETLLERTYKRGFPRVGNK